MIHFAAGCVVILSGPSQHGGGTAAVDPGSHETDAAHRRGTKGTRGVTWRAGKSPKQMERAGKMIGSWHIMGYHIEDMKHLSEK